MRYPIRVLSTLSVATILTFTAPQLAPATDPGKTGTMEPSTDGKQGGDAASGQAARAGGQPVPGASGQTTPSTISPDNAALDKIPVGGHALKLSDEQKRSIVRELAVDTASQSANPPITPAVSTQVPAATQLQEFPAGITGQIPETEKYRYVRQGSTLLIVNPADRAVIDVIER